MGIIGIVRNGGDDLKKTLSAIDRLRNQIEVTRLVFATNDNDDDTNTILKEYMSCDNAVEVLFLDGLKSAIPDRVARIATVRNFTLQAYFRSDDTPELTMILDLDGPNNQLSPDAVLKVLGAKAPAWDAVFCNQMNAYYDLYALRHPVWCPRDCWQEYRAARRKTFLRRKRRRLKDQIIFARQYRIAPDHPWIEVDSAFGGLGIYRTSMLKGCWYSAHDAKGQITCEHVILHQQMRAAGARLFIAPELINLAPDEHLGRLSGAPFKFNAGSL